MDLATAMGAAAAEDVGTLHYENARVSAWHADVAAKQAASLAKWVEVLYTEVSTLQAKVNELEDWKRNTLDLMSALRTEHKRLRKKVLPPDEGEDLPSKAKTLPILLADHVESGAGDLGLSSKNPKKVKASTSLRPPPGLDQTSGERPPPGLEHMEGSKQVRFGAAEAKSPVAVQTGGEEQGTLSISHVPASTISSPTSDRTTRSSVSIAADFTAPDDTALEGVHVTETEIDGGPCEVAVWRIGRLTERLKGCMGRALVSSAFDAAGLKDLRLMVFPDGKEVSKAPRSKRQKELYAKKVSEGPLEGCLKLKVPDCPEPHIVEYSLKVGNVKKGPFRHNFMDSAVNGCLDFGIDWLQQVEADNGLTVSVEILKAPGWKAVPGEGPLTDQ